MVAVTKAKRRSPSCVYCYIRGYRNYPGESRVVLYEDTLERLRHELRPGQPKPRSVYFSPSSDLFQPAPGVLELSHAVLEFLFSQGIGVAFLTKGEIPDETLELLIDHADLVQAQIGLITLDEEIPLASSSLPPYGLRRGCRPRPPTSGWLGGRRTGVAQAPESASNSSASGRPSDRESATSVSYRGDCSPFSMRTSVTRPIPALDDSSSCVTRAASRCPRIRLPIDCLPAVATVSTRGR